MYAYCMSKFQIIFLHMLACLKVLDTFKTNFAPGNLQFRIAPPQSTTPLMVYKAIYK